MIFMNKYKVTTDYLYKWVHINGYKECSFYRKCRLRVYSILTAFDILLDKNMRYFYIWMKSNNWHFIRSCYNIRKFQHLSHQFIAINMDTRIRYLDLNMSKAVYFLSWTLSTSSASAISARRLLSTGGMLLWLATSSRIFFASFCLPWASSQRKLSGITLQIRD